MFVYWIVSFFYLVERSDDSLLVLVSSQQVVAYPYVFQT